jgi:hypothetical protein
MAIMYLVFGIMFTYLASLHVEKTLWNFWTILFALIATYDFVTAVRFFNLNKKIKGKKQQ